MTASVRLMNIIERQDFSVEYTYLLYAYTVCASYAHVSFSSIKYRLYCVIAADLRRRFTSEIAGLDFKTKRWTN